MKVTNLKTGKPYTENEKKLMIFDLKIKARLDAAKKEKNKSDHRHVWKGQERHRHIGYFSVHCGVKGCKALKAFTGKSGDYLC